MKIFEITFYQYIVFFSLFSFLILQEVYSQESISNPLSFREYKQQVTLVFQTHEDALKAELVACPLPKNHKISFSSRWDDTAQAALKTATIMRRHSCKGTFFHNNGIWWDPESTQYHKDLLRGGNSIGLHTANHPFLTFLNSYEHFYQYMNNRIWLEVRTQSPVNSQVLPFCDFWTQEGHAQISIGRALMATGIISTPEVSFPDFYKKISYPEKSLAHSRLIAPGDKIPDMEKFIMQFKKYSSDGKGIKAQPSISIAMHNWHTEEGYKNLDKIYKYISEIPDCWHCNQNEYGAYRYELFWGGVLQKEVSGKIARFFIRRINPSEIGANIPLWFFIKNAQANSSDGATIHGDLLEVPHVQNKKLPDIYGINIIENIAKLKLQRTNNNTITAFLSNMSHEVLKNINITFRLPPNSLKLTERFDIKDVNGRKSIERSVEIEQYSDDFYYRYGRPYYVVQADFERRGINYRLYADLRLENIYTEPNALKDSFRFFYLQNENVDLGALSRSGNDLSILKESDDYTLKDGLAFDCLQLKVANRDQNIATAVVFEFTPSTQNHLQILHSIGECWINGKKITSGKYIELEPISGINRVLIKWSRDTPTLHTRFWVKTKNEGLVKYSKP